MRSSFVPTARNPQTHDSACQPVQPLSPSNSTTFSPAGASPYFVRSRSVQVVVLSPSKGTRRSARIVDQVARRKAKPRTGILVSASEGILRDLLRHAEPLPITSVEILSSLLAPLAQCDYAYAEHLPTENKVAKDVTLYNKRHFAFTRWRQVRPVYRQIQFLRQLRGTVQNSPQSSRILRNETDAKEAYCVNVLTPLVEIANTFIDPELRSYFEVQLLAEYTIEATKHDEEGEAKSAQPIRLDHVLFIVDKRAELATIRKIKIRIPLLIIEAKRHDLVTRSDWEPIRKSDTRALNTDRETNMRTMLPQLLMYVHKLQCHRIVLTDYSDTVTCDIDDKAFDDESEPIPISFHTVINHPAPKPTDPRDVSTFGPRLALAFELYEGLRKLGLLPLEAYDYSEPRKLDIRLKIHLQALRAPGYEGNAFDLPFRPRVAV